MVGTESFLLLIVVFFWLTEVFSLVVVFFVGKPNLFTWEIVY
jgi:hypothetical protein